MPHDGDSCISAARWRPHGGDSCDPEDLARRCASAQATRGEKRTYGERSRWIWQSAAALSGAAFFGLARALCDTKEEDEDDDEDGMKPEDRKNVPAPGGGQCHLRTYTRDEVSKYTTPETRIFVTYKDGVYDITEFVEGHPGGAGKIMLAAGKAIDPYWNIFQQHFRTGLPLKLLEEMRVGTLAPGEYVAEELADPYASDPPRDARLIYHNKTPCNAEVPPEQLVANYLTPNELWFVRHHHPVPVINDRTWELVVTGKGCSELRLSLDQLKSARFPKVEVRITFLSSLSLSLSCPLFLSLSLHSVRGLFVVGLFLADCGFTIWGRYFGGWHTRQYQNLNLTQPSNFCTIPGGNNFVGFWVPPPSFSLDNRSRDRDK